MAKLNSLKADSVAESEGVWVTWDHGVELKIARLNNPSFQAEIRKLTAPLTKRIRAGQVPDDEMEALSQKAMASHILVGWRNIEDEDGKPLKYTPKRAHELLTDPGLRDLYQFVLTQANERELFRLQTEEDSRGNSSASSSGASSGANTRKRSK
tara:strand:+ start:646 stop:1107 length:462 start_codon:yes stop_codon:yes gene_type:complete